MSGTGFAATVQGTRRAFLAAVSLPIFTCWSDETTQAATEPSVWRSALSAAAGALGGPGLLRSYITNGATDFDRVHENCAYTYDNAATGLALLAAGDMEGARRIAAALAYAQGNDRFYHDGRLRNAYRAGPAPNSGTMPLSGWWDDAAKSWREDSYQAGTATGPLAWAMLLWAALGAPFRRNAGRAADFIETQLRAPAGFSGGFFGFEPAPQKLAWVSTEHNTDLAAAFSVIGRTQAARHAQDFVVTMWQPEVQYFAMGLHPDGTLNARSALDANLWPLLLPAAEPTWRGAFATVLQTHGIPPGENATGVDFTTARAGIWLEGTAYVALLTKQLGNAALAERCLATLRANTAPDGQVYATTVPRLATDLAISPQPQKADFFYYRRPHLAATAWAQLATSSTNPLAPDAR